MVVVVVVVVVWNTTWWSWSTDHSVQDFSSENL